jgi:hypothetical protein
MLVLVRVRVGFRVFVIVVIVRHNPTSQKSSSSIQR